MITRERKQIHFVYLELIAFGAAIVFGLVHLFLYLFP